MAWLVCFDAFAACRVVGVADGDTLSAVCDRAPMVKVRIAEIDAPEKRQAFGNVSRQALADLCFGQVAVITPQTRDRYGRTVARVTCQGRDVSASQVEAGLAWVYDRYVTDRSLYALQDAARGAKRGLWVDVAAVAPWAWRRR